MFPFDLTVLTDWISANPEWSLAIVFSIAFIESLAVIGLLMPGWVLLVGVGVLIGTGNINYYFASFYCFIGAVIGEYISYKVGVHYQDRVHQWSVFKKHPDWLNNTEQFFKRYGVASIALGRFVGPVRAFMPLLAGMSSMPALKFHFTNILSAMVWAPVYLIPGVILGASVQIESAVRWILLANIALIVVSGWLLVNYLKNIWLVKHPEAAKTEYDNKHVIIKAFVSFGICVVALVYLLNGSQHEQFYHLAGLLWTTINQ